jgi:hypothetical protein
LTEKRLVLIVQDEIVRFPLMGRHQMLRFSAKQDWRQFLSRLDAELRVTGCRPVLFCSLPVARHVWREKLWLARGLYVDPGFLSWHRYSGLLPPEWLLNRSAILLPFGALMSRRAQLAQLYGSRIFLRPDSAMKPFNGMAMDLTDLEQEVSSFRQLHNPDDDTLVVVDRARAIAPTEYRFWLVEGEVAAVAPYSLDPDVAHPPCPPEVLELAGRIGQRLTPWETTFVADLVLDEEGVPRLVELNGFSTSGWYAGVDPAALAAHLDRLIIG